MHVEIETNFLKMPEVCKLTGLSRASVYRLIAESGFPRPYQLSPNRVGWKVTEINEWIAQLPCTPE